MTTALIILSLAGAVMFATGILLENKKVAAPLVIVGLVFTIGGFGTALVAKTATDNKVVDHVTEQVVARPEVGFVDIEKLMEDRVQVTNSGAMLVLTQDDTLVVVGP